MDSGKARTLREAAHGSVVARESELDAITRLLDVADPGVRALVLQGQAGMGKTTLWEWGIAAARERGVRTLVVRGNEAEAHHPFAGLIDLFDTVGGDELASLPDPQRRALDVALYRADPDVRPPEPQALALAVLSALRLLAEREALLLAVDDLPWLDKASEEALAYATRRLDHDRVRLLLARRPGRPSPVEKTLPADVVRRLEVERPSLGVIRQILARRLGLRLPHHLLRRVYDNTLGNPLFAIEVGRALTTVDLDTVGEHLPIPDDIEDLLGLRIADLDPLARRVLLALALDSDLRVAHLDELAGREAITRAVDAVVVTLDRDRVRAAHPLLAEAAKRHATEEDLRDLHRRIAGVITDEQRQALHLARGTDQPDAVLATRIDGAAERAAARGARRLAVELATHAWRLTPPTEPEHERVLALGRFLRDAGETTRLTALVAPRVASMPTPAARITAYLLLINGDPADNSEILDLLHRALADAGDDPVLRGRVLSQLAENEAVVEVRDIERADERAREAVRTAQEGTLEDRWLARCALAWTGVLRGRAVAPLTEAYDGSARSAAPLEFDAERIAGQRLVWRGELGPARAVLEDYLLQTEERGERGAAALGRLHCCELELRAGRWSEVAALLEEWAHSTDGDVLLWPMYERCRALLCAGRGEVEDARSWGRQAVGLAESTGVRWDWLEANRALGQAALLAKDLPEAVERLTAVWEHTLREGVLDPGAFPVAPDLLEALVATGADSEAQAVVEVLSERAAALDHPWARISAQRGAAVVSLAAAYDDRAAQQLLDAANAYAHTGLLFDEARTLLSLGRAGRRSRKWGAARDALERAAAAFDVLDSPGWAEDAHAELARVGARRPSSEGGLTPTERRVADLAVAGLSNKEIAATLVVTVNTVEFHLRNTYAKLGIRSRAQLAAQLDPG